MLPIAKSYKKAELPQSDAPYVWVA